MSTCYYCEKKLVSKEDLAGEILDSKIYTLTHEEHIIQNALGGFLKSSNILCKKCGDELNTQIDVDFISIFRNLCNNLKIIIDRNTKPNSFVKGNFTLYNDPRITINTNFRRDKWVIYQSNYFFLEEKKIILLILNKPNQKDYIIKKIESDPNYSTNYKIIEINDLQKLEGFISTIFNITNKSFKLGMAKIAAGFATHKGVKRQNLNNILINKNFNDKSFFPYYMNTEAQRKFEDIFETYFSPYHFLYIFTVGSHLVCYIDLFSTFKGFIPLDLDYNNSIEEIYYRKTTYLNNNEQKWLNQFEDNRFINAYKKIIKKSYSDIINSLSSEEENNRYLRSIKNSNHYYFYRLTSYISLLNRNKDYIKLEE
ncbi:HNH endonuclease [Acinetobacter dispersus]|uniref:HNH endonuclease n=1 Tax=Acinetobacter dispersus TaxID=70348 RepID=UPI001F4B99E9|nr:HNH endonuclease [Acinetobacter dispersus]